MTGRLLGWVLVRGTASIVDGGAEHDSVIAALREKYPQYRAMALAGQLIKVTPDKVSSWGQVSSRWSGSSEA